MPELENVGHGFETLNMELYKPMLDEVYAMDWVATSKVQLRENAVSYQVTKQKRKAIVRKTLLIEKELEIEARE